MLVSLALAEVAFDSGFACSQDILFDTNPYAGEGDVPVDVVPTLFFQDCGTGSPANGIVRLFEDEELLLEERIDGPAGEYSHVGVDVELSPDTNYLLSYTSPSGQESLVDFRTGTRTAERLSAPPVFDEDFGWSYSVLDRQTHVYGEIVWQASTEGLTFLEVRDEDGRPVDMVLGYGEAASASFWLAGRGAPTCFSVHQRDVEGTWVDGDTHCFERSARSCSAGGALGLLPALLGLLLVRRR